LLAAVSWPVAYLYGDPVLVPLLCVIAVSLPLDAPAMALRSKLRIELRFRVIALITMGSLLIRYLLVIWLAQRGYGVMSFVWPLPLAAAFNCLATLAAVSEIPWRGGCDRAAWYEILGNSAWVLLTSFLRGFGRNGDYIVLGLIVSQAVVGQYFFGYQLTAQIAMLIAMNLQQVLFPVLSRVVSDPSRQALALTSSLRILLLAAAPVSLGLAVTIAPLEELIWHGKWQVAVPLMQALAVVTPLRLIPDVVHASLTARGRFRASAMLALIEGATLMLAAWWAAELVGENLLGLGLIVGGSQALFAFLVGWKYLA
jgi:PST family polysaccharide transporter